MRISERTLKILAENDRQALSIIDDWKRFYQHYNNRGKFLKIHLDKHGCFLVESYENTNNSGTMLPRYWMTFKD